MTLQFSFICHPLYLKSMGQGSPVLPAVYSAAKKAVEANLKLRMEVWTIAKSNGLLRSNAVDTWNLEK